MRSVLRKKMLLALKIILPTLYLAALVFIFGNSLQTGAQSSASSSRVVDWIQGLFKRIAPHSKIATATGEDYLRLHEAIRILAHFAEFAVLGGLSAGCYLVYNAPKKYEYLGVGSTLFVPILDEMLQYFTAGRAAQFGDVLVDIIGGTAGFFCVIALCYFIRKGIEKNQTPKKEKEHGERE